MNIYVRFMIRAFNFIYDPLPYFRTWLDYFFSANQFELEVTLFFKGPEGIYKDKNKTFNVNY